ncbi:MAG: glycoside hydrolase family 13 protein [Bacteroidales bacterium]|nr:glycoside hydrolase family 13 protein [Bacteroidales bacterium]
MKKVLFTLTFLLAKTIVFTQTIERIEPNSWWVGMKYNTITLLVYGNKISDLQPAISYPNVQLIKTDTVENKNYLFITLKINASAIPGIAKITFNKKGKVLITKDFQILQREKNSEKRESYTQKDAIYLIVPDRFANGDKTNDNVPSLLENSSDRKGEGKRHGGDIQGIINNLGYIQSLGLTQIWCTPLIENNEPEYSYHGYAATDFYKIDPRFGTNELFRQLVQEAKKKGIGLIWDVVLNHCGTEYYFIKDLPSKNWVNFPDKYRRSNFLKTTLTDTYATEIDKKEYTDGWFDSCMADLNQRNPFLAKFLIQNTIWWIEYAGLSGLREDTYSYADKDFLSQWAKTILEEYPKFNIVGEEMTRIVSQVAYWQKGKQNFDGYTSYLPTLMDFLLNDNVVSSLTRSNDWFSAWRDIYQCVAQDYQFPNPENQLIFPDNHDLDRFYTRLNKKFDHWKLGIAIYMTMRGIPQFCYGTEVLMTNDKLGNDGLRRGDFYGGWDGDTKNAITGIGLTEEEKCAKEYFSKLLSWRKTNSAITNGKFIHYAPQQNDVYVYFRYNDKQKVMIILNKNSENVTLDIKRYSQMISSKFKAKEIICDKEFIVEDSLIIPSKTAMILEIK